MIVLNGTSLTLRKVSFSGLRAGAVGGDGSSTIPLAESPSAEARIAPRAREQHHPPSPPDRLPPRRGGGSSPYSYAVSGGGPRALAAAACLSVVCALALPATAYAQEIALVSNIAEGYGGGLADVYGHQSLRLEATISAREELRSGSRLDRIRRGTRSRASC